VTLTLTPDELRELTGYEQPARMQRWLVDRGWVFEPPPRRGGVPRVDRAYYLARMSGQAPSSRRVGPDVAFLLDRATTTPA
jgi:hypothetical protein